MSEPTEINDENCTAPDDEKLIELIANNQASDVISYVVSSKPDQRTMEVLVYHCIHHNQLHILRDLFHQGLLPWVQEWCQANHQNHVLEFIFTQSA